jgi:hypothetical protein
VDSVDAEELDSAQETAGAAEEDVFEADTEKADMVNSEEYQALIRRYNNEKGKINYALMNKDFIQFTSKSKMVGTMVAAKESIDDILVFIVKNRAAYIAEKKDYLTDQEANALIETLDEIDPRSAFKEVKLYIKRLLAKNKST